MCSSDLWILIPNSLICSSHLGPTKMSSKPQSSPTSDQREATPGGEKDDVEGEDLSKLPAHIQSVRDGLLDFLEQRQYRCTGRNQNQGETQLY